MSEQWERRSISSRVEVRLSCQTPGPCALVSVHPNSTQNVSIQNKFQVRVGVVDPRGARIGIREERSASSLGS